jgi:hypothetical protein
VLRFLSVKSIVIAAASTGRDNKSKTAVTSIVQTNNGNRRMVRPLALMLIIVVIKFIAPKIDEAPARCKLNMAKSTDGPECDIAPLSGG